MDKADIHIPDKKRVEMLRPCATFSPSLWVDSFSSIAMIDDPTIDRCLKEVEGLKAEMRCRLKNQSTAMDEKLAFIDVLERLGISYLFQGEIEEELEKIFIASSQIEMLQKQDLSTVSLYFRLLRQHGCRVSSQIFDGFKDEDGFKNHLRTDVKGLLNLCEAAHVMIHGEDILDEALGFASTHLELMIPHLPPSLAKHVSHALEHTLCSGVPRVEARFFISLYDEEEGESKNNSVLRLAKLDYTLLQILHRKELAKISSWWEKLIKEYPYARDRLVEIYFCALGLYFEPQYSLPRIMLTKTLCLLTILDNTYDAYGTLDELKAFTDAVQRWDISEIQMLPEYMKGLYKALLQLYVSYEEELQSLGRSFAVSYAKERMKEQIQSYYIEATWFLEGKTPYFEEYLKNALITFGDILFITTSLLGMESATYEAFEWLKTNPTILTACAITGRLLNDMANCELEKERGQITTGIDCYMKQYGVTKEAAMFGLNKMVENAWKDINEGCLRPNAAPDNIIPRLVLNLARLVETIYKHKHDGFTNPEKGLKPHILAVLVDTFEI